eukprot:scaffold873_cov393-Prasinococcus_capsulatus_cf.AAC.25
MSRPFSSVFSRSISEVASDADVWCPCSLPPSARSTCFTDDAALGLGGAGPSMCGASSRPRRTPVRTNPTAMKASMTSWKVWTALCRCSSTLPPVADDPLATPPAAILPAVAGAPRCRALEGHAGLTRGRWSALRRAVARADVSVARLRTKRPLGDQRTHLQRLDSISGSLALSPALATALESRNQTKHTRALRVAKEQATQSTSTPTGRPCNTMRLQFEGYSSHKQTTLQLAA